MILPTKGVEPERALLTVGAELLHLLDEPKTVSRVWADLRRERAESESDAVLTYDWFVLALDLLYTLGAIDLNRGRLERASR